MHSWHRYGPTLRIGYKVCGTSANTPTTTISGRQVWEFSLFSYSARKLLAQVIVHLADIFNVCTTPDIAEKWSNMLTEESWRQVIFKLINHQICQGDQELQKGVELSPFMDRRNPAQAKMTIGFIDYMVHPFLNDFVRLFPEANALVENLKRNRTHWQDVEIFKIWETKLCSNLTADGCDSTYQQKPWTKNIPIVTNCRVSYKFL